MPELPEVETVCRGLQPFVEGRRIQTLTLRRAGLRFPFPGGFAEKVAQARVEKITRRAKFILKHLDNGLVWMTHLGMTGRYTVIDPDGPSRPGAFHHQAEASPSTGGKHEHVHAVFEGGLELIYSDPRRFGYMDLLPAESLWQSRHFAHLGPEPLSNAWHWRDLLAVLDGRGAPVKTALLDQSVVSGLGNIYVCEALFRAGVSPRRKAGNLGAKRVERLVPHIREVLQEAIAAGGSSLRDFAGAQGSAGYFQHNFDVYDREGEACSNRNCDATIKRIVQSGRSSFYCPKCQR
ncbi:MAG: bifunctional DNA-formamidopyrimidine glycosylase/DNA-(apurinic or apyrimidinic site) lyase [Parvibaculales bacterium]